MPWGRGEPGNEVCPGAGGSLGTRYALEQGRAGNEVCPGAGESLGMRYALEQGRAWVRGMPWGRGEPGYKVRPGAGESLGIRHEVCPGAGESLEMRLTSSRKHWTTVMLTKHGCMKCEYEYNEIIIEDGTCRVVQWRIQTP